MEPLRGQQFNRGFGVEELQWQQFTSTDARSNANHQVSNSNCVRLHNCKVALS